jgi:nitrite reductase/ring-hydroxylating ferredoxin subunit/uncharacterized membrane protein
MLIPFPFAYLFGTACINLVAGAAGRRDWQQTARHMRWLGIGSALVAAVPGFIDYLTAVPPKSSAKSRATKHMLSNVSALGLFAAAGAAGARSNGDGASPPAWATAADVAGAALLAVGGWMGGTLVYRNQIAVDHRYAEAGKWQPRSVALPAGETEIDLGPDDQLGVDQMSLIKAGDMRIVLARTDQGYVAFDDRCTHRGGPLSDGSLACGTVQCPWHGSQFDVRTGAVQHGPAESPIQSYPVNTRDGRVFVSLAGRWGGAALGAAPEGEMGA